MKTLYFMFSERHGEFQGVFTDTGEILGAWWANDAHFRPEYHGPFLEKLGFNCIPIDPQDFPSWYRRLCRYLNVDTRMY